MLDADFYFLVCFLKYFEFIVQMIHKMETHPNIHIVISIIEFFPFDQRLTTNRMIKIIAEILLMNLTSLDFSISVFSVLSTNLTL